MTWPILSAPVASEDDVVRARRRARQVAAELGFEKQDQVRIATAASEIARNAWSHGGGGRIEFALDGVAQPQALVVTVADRGPGIADVEGVLSGRHRSDTGMGAGLVGARRLLDRVAVDTAPGAGTTVTLVKTLGARLRRLGPSDLARIGAVVQRAVPGDVFAELRLQNRELIETSVLLRRQQEELQAVNAALAETNRGVLALYAELEDRAADLRRATEIRSRFHSSVSHELRTPIHSILAIAALVLDRADGELTPEQERQLNYIRQSAGTLSLMVDDLLDLAKAEAGRLELRVTTFTVADLFGALRGVLRPLRLSDAVELGFDAADDLPPLLSDETKIAQILRNLVANALKFTAAGEVRVSARHRPDDDRMILAVRDTGVGIAPEHHGRIFEEFAQVPNPLQAAAKGSGLGLSLSRRLTELVGGTLVVDSAVGKGATFTLTVPCRLDDPRCG